MALFKKGEINNPHGAPRGHGRRQKEIARKLSTKLIDERFNKVYALLDKLFRLDHELEDDRRNRDKGKG
mgnify:CR=1 FL=1